MLEEDFCRRDEDGNYSIIDPDLIETVATYLHIDSYDIERVNVVIVKGRYPEPE